MAHEPDLLDIAEAAALLRVSEMSLRRWTNAGRLPCFRVGGRRERRFRRADLLAFLERSGEAIRVSRANDHLCALYTSDQVRDRESAAFLASGLVAGATCVLVAESRVSERVLARLIRHRPSAQQEAETGRLVVAEYAATAAAQLTFWKARFAAAARAGAESLRVVGDVSGGRLGRRRPFGEVLAYEREYDRSHSRRFPLTTLCLYDARQLSGVQASRMLDAHDAMFRSAAGAGRM